jgi:hypothetical protein
MRSLAHSKPFWMDHCVEQINDQQGNQHREYIIGHLTCPVCVPARDETHLSPAAHDMLSSLLSGWRLITLSANITRAPQMAKRPSTSNSINASSNTVCTFLVGVFQRIALDPALIWVKRIRQRDYIKHKFAMSEYLCRAYEDGAAALWDSYMLLYASNIHVRVPMKQGSESAGKKYPRGAV